jgi:hypothetical protein
VSLVFLLVSLTLDTQGGVGDGIEPFAIDSSLTLGALTIGFLLNSSQGIVDGQQDPAFL